MVAPLDVPFAQGVHDDVWPRTSVVDIPKYMQAVDGKALYDVADGNDEVIGTAGGDDGVCNGADVGRFVHVVGAFVEQFLDDIGEFLRQGLAHFGAGVFAGHVSAYTHELVDGDVIPVFDVLLLGLDQFQFLLRIID